MLGPVALTRAFAPPLFLDHKQTRAASKACSNRGRPVFYHRETGLERMVRPKGMLKNICLVVGFLHGVHDLAWLVRITDIDDMCKGMLDFVDKILLRRYAQG